MEHLFIEQLKEALTQHSDVIDQNLLNNLKDSLIHTSDEKKSFIIQTIFENALELALTKKKPTKILIQILEIFKELAKSLPPALRSLRFCLNLLFDFNNINNWKGISLVDLQKYITRYDSEKNTILATWSPTTCDLFYYYIYKLILIVPPNTKDNFSNEQKHLLLGIMETNIYYLKEKENYEPPTPSAPPLTPGILTRTNSTNDVRIKNALYPSLVLAELNLFSIPCSPTPPHNTQNDINTAVAEVIRLTQEIKRLNKEIIYASDNGKSAAILSLSKQLATLVDERINWVNKANQPITVEPVKNEVHQSRQRSNTM